MKILITGGSGLLGQYLNMKFSENNEILTLYNSNEGNCLRFQSEKINLTNKKILAETFLGFKPDIVVHTAAISRPELCDTLPAQLITDVNVNSTLHLAELCDLIGAKLIFTSTDLVYDGSIGSMLAENSSIKTVSRYAETKIESEVGIKNIFDNYVILRTSLLYGMGMNNSRNNFHFMYDNFKKNLPVNLFYDQFRTPLALEDAAGLISLLSRMEIKNETINFGGSERVSRVELGEILCDIGGFDSSLINKVSMYSIESLHKVADVSMNTDKLKAFGLKQKSIEESVAEIIKNA